MTSIIGGVPRVAPRGLQLPAPSWGWSPPGYCLPCIDLLPQRQPELLRTCLQFRGGLRRSGRRGVLSGMAVHVVRITWRPAECVGPRASVTRYICDQETQNCAQYERRDKVTCSPASFRSLRATLHLLCSSLRLLPGFPAHTPRLRAACKKVRSYRRRRAMSRLIRGSRARCGLPYRYSWRPGLALYTWTSCLLTAARCCERT